MDYEERSAVLTAQKVLGRFGMEIKQSHDVYMRATYTVFKDGSKVYSSMNGYCISAFSKGVVAAAEARRNEK